MKRKATNKQVSLKPWKGKNYKKKRNHFSGIKVLVLGESHYRDDPSKKAFSQDPGWKPYKKKHGEDKFTWFVVEKWGLNQPTGFFNEVANVLVNASGSRDTMNAKIWNDVAFYNYVSTLVPNGKRPHNKSVAEFKEAIQ